MCYPGPDLFVNFLSFSWSIIHPHFPRAEDSMSPQLPTWAIWFSFGNKSHWSIPLKSLIAIEHRAMETENRTRKHIYSFPWALSQGRNDDAASLAGHKLSNFFTPPSWRQAVTKIWSWSFLVWRFAFANSSLAPCRPFLINLGSGVPQPNSAHSRSDVTTHGFLGLPESQWK